MKSADYKQLKKQVEERYKQAIERADKERIEGLAAIDTVWRMLHVPRRKRIAEVKSQQKTESTGELPLPAPKRPYGVLKDTLKESFSLVPETFNCKKVLVAMKQISGHTFNSSSVSNCLKRLAKEGVIEIVKQGRGKSPSIYRLKNIQTVNDIKT